MLSRFPFLPHQCVALELQPDAIKLLQFARTRRGFCIENAMVTTLPPPLEDGWGELQAALCEVVAATQTAGLPVAFALPAQHVITKRIAVAATLSAWECEVELTTQLTHYLPGVTDAVCLDFCKLPSQEDDQQQLLVVAAREDVVQRYRALVQTAGLKPLILDVDVLAVWRALRLSYPALTAESVVAVCDVGHLRVSLSVLQAGQVLFQQQWLLVDFPAWQQQMLRIFQRYDTLYPQWPIECLVLAGNVTTQDIIFSVPLTLIANPLAGMQFRSPLTATAIAENAAHFQLCVGLMYRSQWEW